MNVPAQVIAEGLFKHAGRVGEVHHHVMLKSIRADMAEELLKLRNVSHGAISKGLQRIVRESAFTDDQRNAILHKNARRLLPKTYGKRPAS